MVNSVLQQVVSSEMTDLMEIESGVYASCCVRFRNERLLKEVPELRSASCDNSQEERKEREYNKCRPHPEAAFVWVYCRIALWFTSHCKVPCPKRVCGSQDYTEHKEDPWQVSKCTRIVY